MVVVLIKPLARSLKGIVEVAIAILTFLEQLLLLHLSLPLLVTLPNILVYNLRAHPVGRDKRSILPERLTS